MTQPKTDTLVGDDAASTDITLYFSESVQADYSGWPATTMVSSLSIDVKDATTTIAIPVDNSNPYKGTVTVAEQMVVVDPFDDLGNGATVTVTVDANSFRDHYGNAFAG